MFSDFLLLIGLLFSLYGVTCALTSLIIWLSNNEKEEHTALVIPLYPKEMLKVKVFSVLEKLKNSGVNYVSVFVVDCGLNQEKHATMKEYCERKNICFCKKEELSEYLLKSSFQTDGNKV